MKRHFAPPGRDPSLKRRRSATDAARMSLRRRLPLLAVAAAGVLRLAALFSTRAVITPDTFDYVRQSRLPLFSAAFWGSQHPPFLPLLWKAVPGLAGSLDPERLGPLAPALALDTVIAAACWGVLALTLAALARTGAGRALVLVGVLVVSLAPEVAGWDAAGLSESLSLSLAALLVALTVRYVRAPARRSAIALGLAVLAAVLVRDTNLLLAGVALLPTLLVVRRETRWVLAALAVAAGASLWGEHAGNRSAVPTRNAIGMAMHGSPADAAWFRAHGVSSPDAPRLLLERPPRAFDADPRARELRVWLAAHGRSTWLRFLVSHPRRTTSIVPKLGGVYDPPWYGVAPYVGGGPGDLLHGMLFALVAAAGAAAAAALRRRREVLALASFVPATAVVAVAIWDADSFEFIRHAIAVPVVSRVVALPLAVLGAEAAYDALLRRTAAGRAGAYTA
jgi:hypothetical protein